MRDYEIENLNPSYDITSFYLFNKFEIFSIAISRIGGGIIKVINS